MHAPSMRCSCGLQSSRRGGWPCSSRIASRRCAWRTGSWCSRAASWWTRGRTRTWWRGADCTPSCSACRPQDIGDPPWSARGGDRIRSQGGTAGFLAHVDLVLSRARRRAKCFPPAGVLARPPLCDVPAGFADLRMERHRRFRSGSIQPAQRDVPVWCAGHAGASSAPALADRGRASAVRGPVHADTRTQSARVVRRAHRGRRAVQRSAVRVQGWFTFVFGAMFAMHSHLFGEIMDLEPDRRAGRRSLAGVLGARPAKWLLVAFLAVEAALIWKWARDPWLAAFLAASAAWFTLDVMLLWRDRPYSPGEMRFSFLAWNGVALASMPWVWHAATLAPG